MGKMWNLIGGIRSNAKTFWWPIQVIHAEYFQPAKFLYTKTKTRSPKEEKIIFSLH